MIFELIVLIVIILFVKVVRFFLGNKLLERGGWDGFVCMIIFFWVLFLFFLIAIGLFSSFKFLRYIEKRVFVL